MANRSFNLAGVVRQVGFAAFASALTGCTIGEPGDRSEPTTGLVMEAGMAGGWTYDALILRDRETGCRFTMVRNQPAQPLRMADGRQSGCRAAGEDRP